jgi:hypothetical protein
MAGWYFKVLSATNSRGQSEPRSVKRSWISIGVVRVFTFLFLFKLSRNFLICTTASNNIQQIDRNEQYITGVTAKILRLSSWEMCAMRNNSGALALLLHPDFKFVNAVLQVACVAVGGSSFFFLPL